MDQNRQENNPSQHTLQVHMHLLCCPCNSVMYPYYAPGYRPPILSQPPPIARPSYLHHYQYTQLHVNPPYNMSLPPPVTQSLPQNMNQTQPAVEIAFEPPPRDRRILDKQDSEETRFVADNNRNALIPFTSFGENPLSIDQLQGIFRNLTATQVASLSTDNYIKYLDNGCFIGETIAKKNEQRPCFKNIQNLCNRTRSEVTKPNITVSNIHSQGLPWATKDFIFAFVRAINCWCILRGYLGKDGNLGKIDREISEEFRECYANWEKWTKQLTYHLIQTFHNLDEANSSSNLNAQSPFTCTNLSNKAKFATLHEPQKKKEAATLKKFQEFYIYRRPRPPISSTIILNRRARFHQEMTIPITTVTFVETDCEVISNPYRGSPIGKEYSTYRRSTWEFRNGGLTSAAWGAFGNIIKELERLDISKPGVCLVRSGCCQMCTGRLELAAISKKLQTKVYYYVNEVIHDFRQFINFAYDTYSVIGLFRDAFEKMLKQSFIGLDFSHITGAETDSVGPLVFTERGRNKHNPEGDGDH
ncbi:hypothetical protein RI129_010489 [Pyrocoelia pectoralis]|uniref:Uncharacterized protein n=1 Tax=Pyrocoelia pectoralis TaxID=417401 RepID=A0AAN7ZFT3_9COLE